MPFTASEAETLTCKATAALLGISVIKVPREAAAGRIKAVVQPGRPLRYDRASVLARRAEMLAEHQTRLGGDGNSPVRALGGPFMNGLILAYGSYKLFLLWTVIERTWGPCWWTWLDPVMRDLKCTPCRLDISALARQFGLSRPQLAEEKRSLIEDGVLIEHPDKTLEVRRDLTEWEFFAERPGLLDAINSEADAPAHAAG